MKPEHMVVASVADVKTVEGNLEPSSETPTHLQLYRAFEEIGGGVHTHSLYATAWARAQMKIPAHGTTQADYWHGEVPCTRTLTTAEIKNDYEKNTGLVIAETFKKLNPPEHPAILVASHGPFIWGKNVDDAAHNATVLEFNARLAGETLRLNRKTKPMQSVLLDKHFFRKHVRRRITGKNSNTVFVELLAKWLLLAVEGKDAGASWLWRKHPERWAKLKDKPLVTGLAYAMRLELQQAYAAGTIGRARSRFQSWCRWVRAEAQALASGLLEPMRQAADMAEQHLEGILGRWKQGLTTALLEGHSLFSAPKRKARGYRSTEYQIAMLYFVAGKLEIPYY